MMQKDKEPYHTLYFPSIEVLELMCTIILIHNLIRGRNPNYVIFCNEYLQKLIDNQDFLMSLLSRIIHRPIPDHLRSLLRTEMKNPMAPIPTEQIGVTRKENDKFNDLRQGSFGMALEPYDGIYISNTIHIDKNVHKKVESITYFDFPNSIFYGYIFLHQDIIRKAGGYQMAAEEYYQKMHQTMKEQIRKMIVSYS